MQGAFLSRLLGQTLYILINYTCVIAGVHFFGEKTIKYSLYAMFISVIINLFFTINTYGFNSFIIYLKGLFTNVYFKRGTPLFSIAASLEVQDITMAAGFYLIYYLFYFKGPKSQKNKYLIISIICFILGFKRTGVVALAITLFIYFVLLKKKTKMVDKINYICFGFIITSFIYLILIKYNILENITNTFSINAMGRIQIYQILSSYFNLLPWFIGQGYSFVDKIMYESINFVSHTVIGKMYAELGFIPFILWLVSFIRNNARNILQKYGVSNCSIYILCCLYCFTSFFFENTLTLFCIQYSFLLIPLVYNLEKKVNYEE